MARRPVDLAHSYLLLNHGPVTLVSSAAEGRRNVMAASWAMALDFDPPKVTVVVDRNTLTRELIDLSGEFVLNIPVRTQAAMVVLVGNETGREGDKFARYAIDTETADTVGAPLIEGCAAWLECKVIPETHIQTTYDLFVAHVTAAWADDRVFSANRWHFDDPDLRTLHYVAGGQFFETGDRLDSSGGL